MGYTRSRARKQFDADVSLLLQTVRIAYGRQCSSSAVREYALFSAVLLCSARLESYIEDLLTDWARSIRAQGVTTDKLPRRLRAYLLTQPTITAAYRKSLAENDETLLLSKLELLIGQTNYEFALDGRPLPNFPASLLYSDRKYPSPKNLKRLFNRFGLSNVFHSLNKLAKRDTEAILTSFNDLRTEMAHVGMPVGLSVLDIKTKILDIKFLVSSIDRMFYSQVISSVGFRCWTR